MAEPERIEIAFADNANTRVAAAKWYQTRGLTPWQRRLASVSSVISLLAVTVVVVATMVAVFGLTGLTQRIGDQEAGLAATLIAIFLVFRWSQWSSGLPRRIHDAHDTGEWGTIRCRFDLDGYHIKDDLRDWRSSWRGVSRVEAQTEGLFIAGKGIVFYFPSASWGDPGRMRTEAEQIIAWWRDATGAAA